jgi:hypothetical protein
MIPVNVVKQLSPCYYHYEEPWTTVFDKYGSTINFVNGHMGQQVLANVWRLEGNLIEDAIFSTRMPEVIESNYEAAWEKL